MQMARGSVHSGDGRTAHRAECRNFMQPLAVRLRATRRRLVAETEADVHAALSTAEQAADAAGSMALVDFQAANGNMLSIIVGGPDTALSFRYPGDVPPRFVSVGDGTAQGTVPCSRDFADQIDCPRWSLISRADGLAALDEFAASNDLPHCIRWTGYTPGMPAPD
jgi:hypothetical protein